MTAREIREKYLRFFESHGHAIVPSSSLVPENDPSVLFNTAGMQPLVPYLLGKPHPMGRRIADVQKCIRTGDIDDVGDDTHLTFFEMLGNWSLGDYFKKDSIAWSWEFLTDPKWLALDPAMLSVTVFEGDENSPQDKESAELWKSLGMKADRIAYLPAEDNWWAAGATGPCGPDTEIFYWVGSGNPQGNKKTHPKEWMEIWNNVFMQYNRIDEKTLEKLPAPCVDTGMGLERTTAILDGFKNVYETDAFSDVLSYVRTLVGKERFVERSGRIIADHIRAATHIIADGVVPKNVDQGYVLRRLIRRAIRELYTLGYEEPALTGIAALFIDKFQDVYSSVDQNREKILEELFREESKFRSTLRKGLQEFDRRIHAAPITGKDAFDLFSTYGFPLEMTQEILTERGMYLDEAEFRKEFKKHQNLSRTASAGKFKGGLADTSEQTTKLHTATHLMLAGLRKFLGKDIHQAGSNITEERARFDFTSPEKVSREVLDQVEAYVNSAIRAKCDVVTEIMTKDDARAAGVEGSFWEKYPEKVTVYRVKSVDGTVYSQELCGGPHVSNTGGMGHFRITKEEASSAGVRRVKAALEEISPEEEEKG